MCSTIALGRGAERILAGNYDYFVDQGLIATNLRGTQKENGRQPGEPRIAWTVQHGSVTLNSFSLELPVAGLNEAGLAVALMWHDVGSFGWDDSIPRLSGLQWIQYQLDCHATVDDVVGGLATAQPKHDGIALHYMVLDARGECALIEFISGQPVVTRNPAFAAMTNSTYTSCVAALAGDALEPGDEIDQTTSQGRFATLHRLRADARDQRVDDASAFAVLGAVRQQARTGAAATTAFPWSDAQSVTQTVWSYVIRPSDRAISLVTHANVDVRVIHLDRLELSEDADYRLLDIHTGAGDVSETLRPYNIEDNRRLVRGSARVIPVPESEQVRLIEAVDSMYAQRRMSL